MSSVGGITPVSAIGGVEFTPVSPPVQTRTNAAKQTSPDEKANEGSEEIKQKKRLGVIKCETCENRTYQDGSDDPGVSFKAPTKLSPTEAASAVPAHEREHYNREAADAKQNDREVISNSIKIYTSVCPECGKTYVSGGLTTTVTKSKQKKTPEELAMDKLFGTGESEEGDSNSVAGIGKGIANGAYGLNFDERK